MKTKKITAVLMAAAMAVSMAATTAMSASAEELDTPVQEEIIEAASEVSSTGKAISWGSRNTNDNYAMTETLYKLDMSGTSMADGAISSATIKYDGTNYIITLNTKPITKKYLGINFTADIRTITAHTYSPSGTINAVQSATDSSVYTITIPATAQLHYPSGAASTGYTYGIKLQFTTSLEDNWVFSQIPAMSSPSAFMLFNIAS